MNGPVLAAAALAASVLVLPSSPRQRLARAVHDRKGLPPRAASWVTLCALAVGFVLLPLTTVLAVGVLVATLALRSRRRRRGHRGSVESRELETAIEVLVGELRVGAHPAAASRWRRRRRPDRLPVRAERWQRAPDWAPMSQRVCVGSAKVQFCKHIGNDSRCAGNWQPTMAWPCRR